MPLYEYECEPCGHRFEVIQRFSDPPIETCPKCGGPVHKLLSSPAIQFKGTGWYITDYARKEPVSGGNAKDGRKTAETTEKTGTGDSSAKGSGASEKSAGASDAGGATKSDAASKK